MFCAKKIFYDGYLLKALEIFQRNRLIAPNLVRSGPVSREVMPVVAGDPRFRLG